MIVHSDWQHGEVLPATAENGNTLAIDYQIVYPDGEPLG